MSDILETHFQRQEFNPPPMNATLDDDEDIDEADESGSVIFMLCIFDCNKRYQVTQARPIGFFRC